MDYIIICLISLIVSLITLFSGFGLGTVLMPIFALFFPLTLAITSTAIIHLANNLFKAFLVGKYANWKVVIKFGIPAAFAAILGAYLLSRVSRWPPFLSYQIDEQTFAIMPIGMTIGLIIIFSAFFELVPSLAQYSFSDKWIPLGGFLSGFFGGISGQQGMLRSAFLIKANLSKEEFIGTSALCSIIVDMIRLSIYGWTIDERQFEKIKSEMMGVVLAASLAAFLGAYLGAKLMKKITFKTIQIIVGSLLLVIGIAMIIGII